MISAFTIGSPIAGISARARRSLSAGICNTSAFSDFTRALARAEVPIEHRDIAQKIPRLRGRENLLLAVARLENLDCSLQRNGEREVPLTRLENKISAAQCPPLPQRLEERQLSSVSFGNATLSVSR